MTPVGNQPGNRKRRAALASVPEPPQRRYGGFRNAPIPLNRVRELRHRDGLALYDLSYELRVDQSTISKWETSKVGIPDEAKRLLAEMFGVSIAFLMYWDGSKPPKPPRGGMRRVGGTGGTK